MSFDWLKAVVSITVWKTWKGSCHYTPSHMMLELYVIAYLGAKTCVPTAISC